ncbi:uncharacterized protein BCR38DRAFT_510232 [Pseudomassariella vexata]|uniref:Uncharacterized protein n=1 Tax=Pseudomassariella vexata TaxID=1141098 RepID=A0A1Y2E780_9PEZI|nr:uncharacterized protein BCR38DRAFT_510232 [Pseudomassariella vexata]ORY67400.1 hypothetical protein BCR38DRAFT_510232 [Pseudomassariella vexata]
MLFIFTSQAAALPEHNSDMVNPVAAAANAPAYQEHRLLFTIVMSTARAVLGRFTPRLVKAKTLGSGIWRVSRRYRLHIMTRSLAFHSMVLASVAGRDDRQKEGHTTASSSFHVDLAGRRIDRMPPEKCRRSDYKQSARPSSQLVYEHNAGKILMVALSNFRVPPCILVAVSIVSLLVRGDRYEESRGDSTGLPPTEASLGPGIKLGVV